MHPALRAVLAGLAVCAVILGAGLIGGIPLEDAIANSVFYGLAFGGVLFFISQSFRASVDRPRKDGPVPVFLRYPNALPGSLHANWEKGVAAVGPGRIDFQPAVYDQSIQSGRIKALTTLSILSPPRTARHIDARQGVPHGFQIIGLESSGGVIEIAASPATLRTIQDSVRLG
jgi:hypothetical protein